ncbi:FkbM family methyltransferase [Algoriphagus faecimaris]|uniref:FkbM family methyltransferase n=1 Tax=Algoriphagus faecimaris TaxID=686796 RepID=UPI0011135F9F|nr:FkbM family methyltransferase [Algoriphagus faecimaris]
MVKKAVLDPTQRKRLNKFYHKLTYYEKSIFHALYGRIFRDGKNYDIQGEWILKFAGKEIRIPLESESLWLDWETALSVLGHDYEIKAFYENQINSSNPPACFMDIGANYGTHSLLLLSAGIHTFSIEPNPECKSYFERLASYNQVKGEWFGLALGEGEGKAHIEFPEGETWLGTLSETDFSNRKEAIKSYPVEIKTLDGLIVENGIKPDLIKIDTEGFEEGVIRGGENYIKDKLPNVIFEANKGEEQVRLQRTLHKIGLEIFSLKTYKKITCPEDIQIKEGNFIASKEETLSF